MKTLIYLYTISTLMLLGCSITQAAKYNDSHGIILESTRVIYPSEAKNGITFKVKNNTSFVYLVQSRVIPWIEPAPILASNGSAESKVNSPVKLDLLDKAVLEQPTPFIVLPPLIRFAPHDEVVLRIRLVKNNLPKNKESIFTLSLKAIPSQMAPGNKVEGNPANMVLAMQNNLKFFYRPENIASMNDKEKAMALTFSQQRDQLTITNPTPYYITLNAVSLDKKPLDLAGQRMIAPFSAQTFDSVGLPAKQVSWQLIDDNGRATPEQNQTLS